MFVIDSVVWRASSGVPDPFRTWTVTPLVLGFLLWRVGGRVFGVELGDWEGVVLGVVPEGEVSDLLAFSGNALASPKIPRATAAARMTALSEDVPTCRSPLPVRPWRLHVRTACSDGSPAAGAAAGPASDRTGAPPDGRSAGSAADNTVRRKRRIGPERPPPSASEGSTIAARTPGSPASAGPDRRAAPSTRH